MSVVFLKMLRGIIISLICVALVDRKYLQKLFAVTLRCFFFPAFKRKRDDASFRRLRRPPLLAEAEGRGRIPKTAGGTLAANNGGVFAAFEELLVRWGR